jgi:mRNA interferase MazF
VKHGREVILASPDASIPQRGEIWLVNFDPTIGTEIRKTRPAVVVSSDAVGRLPIKLVAPVTDWKEHFAPNI